MTLKVTGIKFVKTSKAVFSFNISVQKDKKFKTQNSLDH